MYKKKTLRRMQPITRRYARIVNDLDGLVRKLHNLRTDIARLELDASALFNQQVHDKVMKQVEDFNAQQESELAKRIDAAEIFLEDR